MLFQRNSFKTQMLICLLSSVILAGCSDDTWESVGMVAPDFAFIDQNPSSPTYNEIRQVAKSRGKVIILYFADYG